jgi:hypothetical protein
VTRSSGKRWQLVANVRLRGHAHGDRTGPTTPPPRGVRTGVSADAVGCSSSRAVRLAHRAGRRPRGARARSLTARHAYSSTRSVAEAMAGRRRSETRMRSCGRLCRRDWNRGDIAVTPSREAARLHSRSRTRGDDGRGPVRLLATSSDRVIARLRLVAKGMARAAADSASASLASTGARRRHRSAPQSPQAS